MKRYLISALVIILLPVYGLAQTGLPPFGSLDQTRSEVRNNQNLNVFFAIPIMSSPGRGVNLNFSIYYNALIWTNCYGTWSPYCGSGGNWGWATTYSPGSTTYSYSTTQRICDRNLGDVTYIYTTTYQNYVYTDPQGTPHTLPLYWQQVENDCTNQFTTTGTFSGYTTDGSGYLSSISEYNPSNPAILSKGGISVGGGEIIDTNGNYISSTTNGSETDWTDSAGRVALKIIVGSSSIQYEVLNPQGTYETTTLNLETLNVKTNFGCSGVTEFSGPAFVPVSIVLPNQQQYSFTYEASPGNPGYSTGRLQRMTLPTNGYYEYDYTGSNDGINCADGTTLSMNRTVSDGTNVATWTYLRNASSLTTTITTPKLADTAQANDMVVTFNSFHQETSRKIYANSPGTGTPLRTINTTWASNGTPATQVTILEDGTTQSEVATTYDSNGLLDSVSEYNFGAGAPGSLFRTTTYAYQTSTNYTSKNILDLVTSKQIKDGSGTMQYRQDIYYDSVALLSTNCETGALQHYDSSYPCSFNYRGNPTMIETYLSPATQGNAIIKNFTYDWFGNLITAQLNCCQNKTWAYSSATQYSLPDSVTSGSSPSLTTSFQYNAYTGQVSSSTDPNGLVTSFSYDPFRRLTQASQTNGPSVSYSYDDVHFTSTATAAIDSSKSIQQITALDTLGRPNLTTTEDASDTIYSKTAAQYDLAGRTYQSSNPYTGSSPSYWTTTAFDALGRPTSITAPDNSVSSLSYSTSTTTTTDPAGIKRESVADAAGRLITMWEPDPTNNNSLTLQTSYTYNVLNELTQITQSSQTRTYAYDALGRLFTATTPEAGTVCFGTVSSGSCQQNTGYDQFDNLLYRTDARGVVTNYIYDSLNRLLGVAYPTVPNGVSPMPNYCKTPGSPSNNANVCFTYGTSAASYNNGLLVTMNDGVGSENYTYNSLEQLTQLQKVIGSNTYTTGYAYNLAGQLTQLTYPSGRVVQQSVDPIGRLCEVAPSTTGCSTASSPFATGLAYSAAGQMTGFKYGNGIYASFGFSPDRLQLNCIDYSTTNRGGSCTHDGTTKFGLSYSYPTAPSNNGLISSITDSVDNGRSATYTYDSLYRLVTAATNGSANYPAWGLQESYDRYGNRNTQSILSGCSGITCPTFSTTASTTTNRLPSPYTYDSSGNLTYDGLNTMVYDAENHVTSATNGGGSGTYTYDGNGRRVEKVGGGNTIVTIFLGNQVLAEYYNGAAPSAPTNEYIYAGSMRVASIQSGTTDYWHNDHLSPRVRTDTSGNVADQRGTFPFGETWYTPGSTAPWMFTTYYRDVESGNDYAQARTYGSGLGRFSSPDPVSGSTSDPQSLNRYSYVRNMPVMLTDPFGQTPSCNTARSPDTNQPQDSKSGGGPSATEPDNDFADPEAPPQQSGCGQVAPWYYSDGGGGSVSIDGGEAFDPGDGASGLVGSANSNGSASVGGGAGGWMPDGSGGYYNPTDGCYTNRGNIYCNWEGYQETFGGASPGLDLSGLVGLGTGPGGGGGLFGRVRQVVQTVLNSDNDCSKFFNNSPTVVLSTYFSSQVPDNPTSAAQFFGLTSIQYNAGQVNLNGGIAGAAENGLSNGNPTIWISLNSAYDDTNSGQTLGSFGPGRTAGQAIVILHEFAHLLSAIPSDSNNPGQSWANNDTIDTHCRNAIIAALGGHY
jgi:RHS repeat-associated protein